MQRRLAAINPGFQVSEVVARGHQKPCPGAPVNTSAAGSTAFNIGNNQPMESRPRTPEFVFSSPMQMSSPAGAQNERSSANVEIPESVFGLA